MWMKTAIAVAVLGLVGCGGSTSEDESTSSAPEASVACESVPDGDLARLAEGAESDVGTITLTNGRAFKSDDYESVYFIAAELSADGVDGETGVWATNTLPVGSGSLLAVDGIAKQFTVWPDSDTSSAEISSTDSAVSTVRDCAA